MEKTSITDLEMGTILLSLYCNEAYRSNQNLMNNVGQERLRH